MIPVDMAGVAWLDMGMDELRARPATRKQAEAVLKLVERKYASWLKTWPMVGNRIDFDAPMVDVDDEYRPRVVEHWGDDDATVIVWENNAPDSWALHPLTEDSVDEELAAMAALFTADAAPVATVKGAKGTLPKGVYTDAYFSFVLAVYQEG